MGPLEAGGGGGWGGPRCWSPDREMAFLQARANQKRETATTPPCFHGTRLPTPAPPSRRTGFLACWPVNYSWRETAFELEIRGGGEREQLGGEAPAALGDGDVCARSPDDSARPVFPPLPFFPHSHIFNCWTSFPASTTNQFCFGGRRFPPSNRC